jgi:hypothetical protein
MTKAPRFSEDWIASAIRRKDRKLLDEVLALHGVPSNVRAFYRISVPNRTGKRDPSKREKDHLKALCRAMTLILQRPPYGLMKHAAFHTALDLLGIDRSDKRVNGLWRVAGRNKDPLISRLAERKAIRHEAEKLIVPAFRSRGTFSDEIFGDRI